jgi:DNA-directed RNA polymerase specialized sigma24 family protein
MVDPTEIETRFAVEDGMAYMASIFTEPSKDALERITSVLAIMEELPPLEADFIDLYFFRGFKQTDIAAIFGVSQPTVCYRLKRAAARISFLLQMPKVDEEELRQVLLGLLEDRLDVRIMHLMRETTCQSEVAKRLGVSQGLVRHRFIRTVNRMRRFPALDPFVRLYDFISANLNILREVQRPEWDIAYVID